MLPSSLVDQKDGQPFRSVGSKHQDTLDVPRPRRAGDERHEGGQVFPVALLHVLEGGGEVGNHLRGPRDDDMMRREDGERAATGALDGDHDAACLGDKNLATGDSGIA